MSTMPAARALLLLAVVSGTTAGGGGSDGRPCVVEVPGLPSSLSKPPAGVCRVLNYIWRMQNPEGDCGARRLLVVDFKGFEGDGFASIVHTAASALAEGLHSNRTVVLGPSKLAYRPGGRGIRCAHDLECYFRKLSKCRFSDVPEEDLVELFRDGHSDGLRVKWADEQRGNVAAVVPPKELRSLLGEDSHRMWLSLVLNFVFRPRDEHLSKMRDQAETMGFERPAIGVHIRRGDTAYATWKKSTFPPSDYYRAAVLQSALVNTGHVFVATDDTLSEAGLREAQKSDKGGPKLKFLVPSRKRLERSQLVGEDSAVASYARQSGGVLSETLAFEAMADVWILSECDAIVGTGSSHFVALAAALRYAKGMTLPPHYLDASGLVDGSHSVGLFHAANLKAGQEEEKQRRWHLAYQHFVEDPKGRAVAGQEFFFDVTRGIVNVSEDLFDREVASWARPVDLDQACPTKYAVLPLSTASLINLGIEYYMFGKLWTATACLELAIDYDSNPQHVEVAVENLEAVRMTSGSVLVELLSDSARESAKRRRKRMGEDAKRGRVGDECKEEGDKQSRPEGASSEGALQAGDESQQAKEGGSRESGPDLGPFFDDDEEAQHGETAESKSPFLSTRRKSEKWNERELLALLKRTGAKCPLIMDIYDVDSPHRLASYAADVLYPRGKLLEACACFRDAMLAVKDAVQVKESVQSAVESNWESMLQILRPGGGQKRLFHNIGQKGSEWPDYKEFNNTRQPDQSIMVWDGVLSETECDDIIRKFESSEHFQGNLISQGKVLVDESQKKANEFHIASGADTDEGWAAVDLKMLSIMVQHLCLYEEVNKAIKTHRNPLGDEGFRMKRYLNDGTEHHFWHCDSGQEADGHPKRLLAVLIYLNDVLEGGETAFLYQGVTVRPKCGRVAIFPTAFTHVHAGTHPKSGPKYNVANFITA